MIRRTWTVGATSIWLAASALAMNLLLLAWYLLRGYQNVIHSDSASRVLLAREIFDTHRLFPADWVYVNGDILAFSTHLAVVPLLFFLPAGFTVHAMSSLLFAAIVLNGVWLVSGVLGMDRARRLLSLAVVAGGLSPVAVEYLFGQLTYGVILGFCLYFIYFAWRAMHSASSGARWGFAVALAGLAFLACASNPRRAALSYFIPLASALVFHALSSARRRVLWAALPALAGAVAGGLFYAWLFPLLLNNQGVGDVRWVAPEHLVRNLALLWAQYLAIVAGRAPTGESVGSLAGFYWMAKLAIALVLAWLIQAGCRAQLAARSSGGAFACAFALVMAAAFGFLALTTTVSDPADPAGASRFLVPCAVLLVLVALAWRVDFALQPVRGCAAALVALSLVMASWSALYADVRAPEKVAQRRDRVALQQFLLHNGLHFGYAPYWNAALLSVMSNEALLVRPVTLLDGLPIPAPWISSMRWYAPESRTAESFLMLTPDQARAVDWAALAQRGGAPSRELAFGGFRIFVFEDNLAARGLPGWPSPWELLRSRAASPGGFSPPARP